MSEKTKIKIAVEVTQGYNTVFTHQETSEIETFSKEKILECLIDFSDDMKLMVNRTKHIDKIESQMLLESKIQN